ncbi:MAG: signal recognition particle-docking protein FtsY, partial [Chloroflexota bacterium]
VARGADVVLADTAGRLHTKFNLMEELRKVSRVAAKQLEGAPHEVLLVLDATTGQNAIIQAKQFDDTAGVTGLIVTKLDGTSKGGVIFAIRDELGLPIKFIGTGEKLEDLAPFDPDRFVAGLFA